MTDYPQEEFRSVLLLREAMEVRVWGGTELMAMEDVIEHRKSSAVRCLIPEELNGYLRDPFLWPTISYIRHHSEYAIWWAYKTKYINDYYHRVRKTV